MGQTVSAKEVGSVFGSWDERCVSDRDPRRTGGGEGSDAGAGIRRERILGSFPVGRVKLETHLSSHESNTVPASSASTGKASRLIASYTAGMDPSERVHNPSAKARGGRPEERRPEEAGPEGGRPEGDDQGGESGGRASGESQGWSGRGPRGKRRDVAEIWPRYGRGMVEIWPRHGRDVAEMLPRCCRDAAEMRPRCGRDVAKIRGQWGILHLELSAVEQPVAICIPVPASRDPVDLSPFPSVSQSLHRWSAVRGRAKEGCGSESGCGFRHRCWCG